MILSVPKTKYTDFYDQARFKLIWRICIIMIIFLPLLGISQYMLAKMSPLPSILGLLVCIFLLVFLKQTSSYKIPAIFFTLLGTILSQWTFLFFPSAYHIVDTLWMLIIILLTFFTLGKGWGFGTIAVDLLCVIYYYTFDFNENLSVIQPMNTEDIISTSINFIICFLIIGYLINQFIILSNYAEIKYRALTKQLQSTNQEKTIMLKEIHHRVKNNLQVITSLLRLQSYEIQDEKHKTLYQESINRVVAMALIHEKMYQSENLAKIDLEEYINSLASDLLKSYSVEKNIKINVKSDIENIENKSLVPLALIFNELISNSLKHAFLNQESGKIDIEIVNNLSYITLEYHDNGNWKTTTKDSSFGLELIDSLTDQLSGTFERNIAHGTHYNFRFAPEN